MANYLITPFIAVIGRGNLLNEIILTIPYKETAERIVFITTLKVLYL